MAGAISKRVGTTDPYNGSIVTVGAKRGVGGRRDVGAKVEDQVYRIGLVNCLFQCINYIKLLVCLIVIVKDHEAANCRLRSVNPDRLQTCRFRLSASRFSHLR